MNVILVSGMLRLQGTKNPELGLGDNVVWEHDNKFIQPTTEVSGAVVQ